MPLRDPEDIDAAYEATTGDVAPDGSWPVWIARRESGERVLTFQVRQVGDRLEATYTKDFPAFDDEFGRDVFVQAYLGTFADNHYRGEVARIALRRDDGGAVFESGYPWWADPAGIDEELEAMASDVEPDGWGPVVIVRRATGETVIRMRVRQVHDRLEATYTVVDPAYGDPDDVKAIYAQAFLATFTGHYYRDRVWEMSLSSDDGRSTKYFKYPGRG
jgi:hypothetical protein